MCHCVKLVSLCRYAVRQPLPRRGQTTCCLEIDVFSRAVSHPLLTFNREKQKPIVGIDNPKLLSSKVNFNTRLRGDYEFLDGREKDTRFRTFKSSYSYSDLKSRNFIRCGNLLDF